MEIVNVKLSEEVCQEAGWRGIDVFFSRSVEEKDVLRWAKLGRLIYLDKLKEPFFKISSRSYMLKGFCGRNKIKIGFAQSGKTFESKDDVSRFLMLMSGGNNFEFPF